MKNSERRAALDDIVKEIPRLRRFARYLAKDITYADDLVQDCLLRAVAKIDSWQPGTNLRAWLFVILKNVFLNNLRTSKREIITDFTLEDEVPLSAPARQESSMALLELNRQFLKLSHEHQEILLLVAVEGFKYDEAAEILNLPIGTIRSRLARARQALVSLGEERDMADDANLNATRLITDRASQKLLKRAPIKSAAQTGYKKRGVHFQ